MVPLLVFRNDQIAAIVAAVGPALVIVGIGGNDFLRQMSAAGAKDNIRAICRAATAAGAQVMLVAVPQFSLLAASTGRLTDHPLYAELASELRLPLYEGGWAEVLEIGRAHV